MITGTLPARAIVLARISAARDDDTHGVDGQLRDGRALADRLGWRIAHTVVENDTSAFKRRRVRLPDGRSELRTVRPDFRAALAMLADGRADGLIAVDLDRTARDPRDLEDLIDVIESRRPRVPVESVTGSLRLSNDADVSMARVMVAIANKSSRDTARRVAAEAQKRAGAGRFSGGIRRFGRDADGVTVRDAEAAEIRSWAARVIQTRMTAEGAQSAITADLNRRGVPTVKGGPWRVNTVRSVLLSPAVAGHASYRGEIVTRDAWPAILDDATWQAVALILDDPARRTGPGRRPALLLTGIMRCGKCGAAMRSAGGHQPGRAQYGCRVCFGVTVPAPPADLFVQTVAGLWLDKYPAARLPAIPAPPGAEAAEVAAEIAALRADQSMPLGDLVAKLGDAQRRLAVAAATPAPAVLPRPSAGVTGPRFAAMTREARRAVLADLLAVELRPGVQGDRWFRPSRLAITMRGAPPELAAVMAADLAAVAARMNGGGPGSAGPRGPQPRHAITCEQCGGPGESGNALGRFCSRQCAADSRRARARGAA